MRISFLLPGSAQYPIGGFKTVFEYANGLFEKGYKVNIVLPFHLEKKEYSFISRLKIMSGFYRDKILKKYLPDNWFNLNKNISIKWIPYLEDKFIPDADFIVLTSWHTADIAGGFSDRKGKKIYFLQSFETWHGKYEDVLKTWKMPFKKIVISKWLEEIGNSINEKTTYIPNGLDFNVFGIDVNPEKRNPKSICMLYHENEIKGSKIGLEAILKLHSEIPDISITLFSVCKRPEFIPKWINFIVNPEQSLLRSIYNNSAILVNPSLMEGFPLVPAEALICGTAIIVSDIGGHKEYSIDNKTALLFPSGDVNSLLMKLKLLISDNDLRINLAYGGNEYIRKFTWDSSISKFEKLLVEYNNE